MRLEDIVKGINFIVDNLPFYGDMKKSIRESPRMAIHVLNTNPAGAFYVFKKEVAEGLGDEYFVRAMQLGDRDNSRLSSLLQYKISRIWEFPVFADPVINNLKLGKSECQLGEIILLHPNKVDANAFLKMSSQWLEKNDLRVRGMLSENPGVSYNAGVKWEQEYFDRFEDEIVAGVSQSAKHSGYAVFNHKFPRWNFYLKQYAEAISTSSEEVLHVRKNLEEEPVDISGRAKMSIAMDVETHYPVGSIGYQFTHSSLAVLRKIDTVQEFAKEKRVLDSFYAGLDGAIESCHLEPWLDHIIENANKNEGAIGGDNYERTAVQTSF
jgi:hypothetical protein